MKKKSSLTEALLETADDMRRVGILSKAAHEKITKRHLKGAQGPRALKPSEIKAMRQRSKMSQAAFAHHLNLTPGYLSQIERGTKRPAGATLMLLDIVRRKGIEAIL